MSKLAIITPTHKTYLSPEEVKRLRLTLRYNLNYPHYFLVPDSLNTKNISKFFPLSKFIKFGDNFFESKYHYNSLMLEPSSYLKFFDFKYVLLCELDAFVVRNLEPIFDFEFTYLGPAWNPSLYMSEIFGGLYCKKLKLPFVNTHELQGGTGGLSLRNTEKLFQILTIAKKSKFFQKFIWDNRQFNEDICSVYLLKKFGIEPVERKLANQFFIETTPRSEYNIQEIYGFHRLYRYDPKLEHSLLNSVI